MTRTLLLVAFATAAGAQSLYYDAGTAGTPPTAPAPVELGWSQALSGQATVGDVSPDPDWPVNAWQLNDPGPGFVGYDRGYLGQLWTPYEVVLVFRPLAGTLYLQIDTGQLFADSLWEIELELVGSDLLVHRVNGSPLVCGNAGDGAYHELRFSGHQVQLDCSYDGVSLGLVSETDWGPAKSGAGVRWGTLQGKAGRARFQRVELTSVDWGSVGTSYCGPAVPHSGGLSASLTVEGMVGNPTVGQWKRLRATDMAANEPGYFLLSQTQAFVQPPGSQGNLCLGGSVGRYSDDVGTTGAAGSFWLDAKHFGIPAPPGFISWGETWNFQAWFRDGATSNFTDGVSVQF